MAPWQRSQYMMQLMMINLVACFACLCGIAFAQFEFSEAISGSVSFPDVAFACIGNLAVFFTSLLRGRLDLENGARDVLATNRGPQLVKTNESEHHGWTTCNGDGQRKYKDAAVLMLSRNTSDPSIKQFMRYIQYSHGVHSILLKGLPLEEATDEIKIQCHHHRPCSCCCILLWTEEEEMRMMVARRMPGTLKQLSDSVCLLPSEECLTNGRHGCDQGLLHVKESGEIHLQLEEDSEEESPATPFREIQVEDSEADQPVLRSREEDSEEESPATPIQVEDSEADQPVRRSREEDSEEESPATPIQVEDSEAEAEAARRLKVGELKAESRAEIHVDIKDTVQQRLTEEGSPAKSLNVVCQILDVLAPLSFPYLHGCMCIPLREAEKDEWTKLVIRMMRSKDKEGRGVRVMASDAMEKYIDRSGESGARVTTRLIEESYTGFSLLVQRFIEIIVNVLLTWWLRVDGLCSSLIARRVVRDYLVDSKGTGFAANAFLTQAFIKCNQSSVCQILWFRGKILGVRTLAYVVGCVNLICSIGWVVLIASEGSVGKGYVIHSTPPSKYRVIVVLVGIGIALLMDSLGLLFLFFAKEDLSDMGIRELSENKMKKKFRMVCAMMVLEIVYIVAGCVVVVKGLGMQKSSEKGRWVYSALHILIWVKWGIGSYLLGDRDDRVDYSRLQERRDRNILGKDSLFVDLVFSHGVMVYSTAFLLNAILAGVRGKWES